MDYDFIIIGGGIVGLSTAWQLQTRYPGARTLLLEKEDGVARHQSGRNSGVIHAGVYYEPGSLKARLCKEGAAATYAFCNQYDLPCKKTGKLLIATDEKEEERLHTLFERCMANQLNPELLGSAQLEALEPAITGAAAILVRESGITDYPAICRQMLRLFTEAGGMAKWSTAVTEILESPSEVTIQAGEKSYKSGQLIVCGGLMADRLAAMQGLDIEFRVIPFRGEYFCLASGLSDLVSHLIYPIPDPDLPFLGVHLTPMIDGSLTVGPNAVQGWKREGYGKINIDWRDISEILGYSGFWKLAAANFGHGIRELKNSVWKPGYLKQINKYCPGISENDLRPYRNGVRAQVVLADGTMVDDFLFHETPRSLHVCNAPSPAATSAIPIGNHICERVNGRLRPGE